LIAQPANVSITLPDTLRFIPVHGELKKNLTIDPAYRKCTFSQPEGMVFASRKKDGLDVAIKQSGGYRVFPLPLSGGRVERVDYARFLTFAGPLFLLKYMVSNPADTSCINEYTAYFKPGLDSVLVLQSAVQCREAGEGYYKEQEWISYDTLDESIIPDDIVHELIPNVYTYTNMLEQEFDEDLLIVRQKLVKSVSAPDEQIILSGSVYCYIYTGSGFVRLNGSCD